LYICATTIQCTRSLMDKMLDSGSDDGGSSPFGCTKYGVNTNKIRVFKKLLYKTTVQLKAFAIMSDAFFYLKLSYSQRN
jgi:hypothetical protein